MPVAQSKREEIAGEISPAIIIKGVVMDNYLDEEKPDVNLSDLGLIYLYRFFSADMYSAGWMGGLESDEKDWEGDTRKEKFIEWVNNGYCLKEIREYDISDIVHLRDCAKDFQFFTEEK